MCSPHTRAVCSLSDYTLPSSLPLGFDNVPRGWGRQANKQPTIYFANGGGFRDVFPPPNQLAKVSSVKRAASSTKPWQNCLSSGSHQQNMINYYIRYNLLFWLNILLKGHCQEILCLQGEDRRKWDAEFGIRHYAGTVVYKVSLGSGTMRALSSIRWVWDQAQCGHCCL